MSTFNKCRIRCPLNPSKVGEDFKSVLNDSQTPKAYKSASMRWELVLVDGDGELLNIDNIVKVQLYAKPQGNPAADPILLSAEITAGNLNTALEQAQWEAGTGQHVIINFSGLEMSIAAGNYDVTVHGTTADESVEPDVFGISTLTILDRGLSNLTAPVPPGTQVATIGDVQGLEERCVKYGINPPNKFPIIVDSNSVYGTALKTGNDGQFDPQQITL